jgi:hypothetical protein
MQDQIIQQERVQQQVHVNNNNCEERPWESIDDKQQAANDIRKEGLAWANISTPCQRTGMRISTVGYQVSRGKGSHRDNGRVIMIIRIVMGEKDGKVHLYGHTMIRRTSLKQGKFNKRRNNRNR